MHARLQRLRERTNGYTVTPAQYVIVAYVALGALTLIVLSGAAVRLTGSGLGCPDWPKCYGKAYPPLTTHAIIEFSNRAITAPVSIAAGLAWLLALRRRPYRRDLAWLGGLLPLGVIGQAVLGGFTVRGALDYGWVMGHFALSMLIILAAALLVWRASHEPRERDRPDESAAGPHAGGSPGQRINRLSFDGRATMDFVIHRHAEIAFVFSVAAVGVWWLARRRGAPRLVRRSLTVLAVLLALQGVVGLVQYETQLPTELVWVHVGLACGAWLSVLWAAFAAGRLLPRGARNASERTVEGPLRAVAPVKFPGN
jgi:cytochrome c oxidase assembly protein subunit 15